MQQKLAQRIEVGEHPASIAATRVTLQHVCERAITFRAAYEREKRREDPCFDEELAETWPIDVVETCFDCGEIIEDGRPGCDCCDPMPSLDEHLAEVAA